MNRSRMKMYAMKSKNVEGTQKLNNDRMSNPERTEAGTISSIMQCSPIKDYELRQHNRDARHI